MVVRIPPPVVFALFLGMGLLLNIPHMREHAEANLMALRDDAEPSPTAPNE